jgi:hypothetical protein
VYFEVPSCNPSGVKYPLNSGTPHPLTMLNGIFFFCKPFYVQKSFRTDENLKRKLASILKIELS